VSSAEKIPVAVAGATGYVGAELVRLLCAHPRVDLVGLSSEQYHGQRMSEVYPFLRGRVDHVLQRLDPASLAARARTVFTALPHGAAATTVADLLERGCRVIDLSADFRLRDPAVYARSYTVHPAPELLALAVYGLPEAWRDEIETAQLVATPGCYPTGMLLATIPLLRRGQVRAQATIIVDAKSGATGAGRGARTDLLFCEVAESVRPYSIGVHRHAPEMEQEVARAGGDGVSVLFAPHLVPLRRGILSTVYVPLAPGTSVADCEAAFRDAYERSPFVHLLGAGVYPALRDVQGTNRCGLGWWGTPGGDTLVVTTAIDNLGKGAAGQAIQCFNIQIGCPEATALDHPALVP
jgi:N-acetyl-gamma-glutamyl-phosphate reductase